MIISLVWENEQKVIEDKETQESNAQTQQRNKRAQVNTTTQVY